jgi:murein L,D-transpeptidase YafK
VVIGNQFVFDAQDKQAILLASVQHDLQAWKNDWQSLDSDAYLSHYHNKFRSGKYNLKRWSRYKKRVNGNKSFIKVNLSDFTIIHDPSKVSEGEVVVVDFKQDYQSSNYSDSGKKRLYLTRQDAQTPWQILIEESLEP